MTGKGRWLGLYLKGSVWDFILCVIIVCSVNITVFSGFYISDYMHYNYPLLIGMAAGLNTLLFFAAYNRRSILTGIGISVVAVIIFVVFAQQNVSEGIFTDSESNPYLYYIIAIPAAVAIFLLTRTKVGTGIMFVSGVLLLSAIQFLYESMHLFSLILFLMATGTMYIYKNYRRNILNSKTIRTAPGRTTAISAVLCVLIIGLGFAAYSGIVQPINPSVRDLKLITEYKALPTLEQLGIAGITEVPDYDQATNKKNDKTESAKNGDKKKDTKDGINDNKDKDSDVKNTPAFLDSLRNALFYVVNYLMHGYGWLVLLIVLIAVVTALVSIRLYLRKRWLKGLSVKSREVQVMEMYRFYLARLHKLKIRKPPEDTLFQFVSRANPLLIHFNGGGVSFADLTETYVRANYGAEEIGQDELMEYLAFHAKFYVNCREYIGRFKYVFKFFSL
jgi:hypothetical protein